MGRAGARVVPTTSGPASVGFSVNDTAICGFTVTVVVALPLSSESLAVSCKTYVPVVEKLAVVTAEVALLNVTVPGPLTFDQA